MSGKYVYFVLKIYLIFFARMLSQSKKLLGIFMANGFKLAFT